MAVPTIEARGVGKQYRLGENAAMYGTLREALGTALRRGGGRSGPTRDIWALRDVDLSVHEGEAMGLIGSNGAGKTTLLRILARITEPTVGVTRTRGRVGALLEVGTGFHPELSGRDNVFLSGAVMGMTRSDVRRRFGEIIEFAGVEAFADTPLKRYSSGMRLRLAFAVAAHLEPELMLVDEVLAVGDYDFQRRCLNRMATLREEGRTVVFVSHDLGAITRLCSRAVWIDHGRVSLGPIQPALTVAGSGCGGRSVGCCAACRGGGRCWPILHPRWMRAFPTWRGGDRARTARHRRHSHAQPLAAPATDTG
jgi:lipopolysaccharide transport system ATP-binding protein